MYCLFNEITKFEITVFKPIIRHSHFDGYSYPFYCIFVLSSFVYILIYNRIQMQTGAFWAGSWRTGQIISKFNISVLQFLMNKMKMLSLHFQIDGPISY